MNWLISLVMAGAMLTSEGELPMNTNYNLTESNIQLTALCTGQSPCDRSEVSDWAETMDVLVLSSFPMPA